MRLPFDFRTPLLALVPQRFLRDPTGLATDTHQPFGQVVFSCPRRTPNPPLGPWRSSLRGGGRNPLPCASPAPSGDDLPGHDVEVGDQRLRAVPFVLELAVLHS